MLITGSTGFIGSRLLEAFVERGHEVVAVKRSTSNPWRIEHLLNRIQTIDADKNSPAEILAKYPVDEKQLGQARVDLTAYQPTAHFARHVVISNIRLSDWEAGTGEVAANNGP